MSSSPEHLAFFHDQKSDEHFESLKTGKTIETPDEVLTVGPQAIQLWQANQEARREMVEEAREEGSRDVQLIKIALQKIDGAILTADAEMDPEQRELLKTKKAQARRMIEDTLKSVGVYIVSIRENIEAKNRLSVDTVHDDDNSTKRLHDSEIRRTRSHDALMSQMQATIRFITLNFAEIPLTDVERYREELEEKNRPYLDVERQPFPPMVFCPNTVDFNSRTTITVWARELYTALQYMKNPSDILKKE